MRNIKSRLIAIATLDINQMADRGRFDVAIDLRELTDFYREDKITRAEYLREYAQILERD